MVEVVVNIWEDTCCHVLQTYRLVVEGRTRYRHEDEDDVINKEGRKDDESCPIELFVAPSEVINSCCGNHWIIGGIAHVEQFAE